MVTFRAITFLLAFTSLAGLCSAAARVPTMPKGAGVRFVSTQPGEVLVPVTIGGNGPYRFLLDTGSSNTAVSRELADLLALRPVAKSSLTTSTGTVEILVVRMDRVSVGPVETEALLPSVLPPAASQVLGPGVSGILGQDFLGRFNYTLDYRRSIVLWNDAPDSSTSDRLALVPADGRFFVELPQTAGALPLRFVPDSGADGLLIFNIAAVPVSGVKGSGAVQSVVGMTTATDGTVKALKVGRQTLRRQAASVLNAAGASVERGDGLLPLHLFSRVHFNNAEGYMTVE